MHADRSLLFEARDAEEAVQLWSRAVDGETAYELMINGVFIMASYNGLSSELMVRHPVLSHEGKGLRLLIGGLGLGYSVREACRHDSVAGVDVVELNRHVIDINRRLLGALNGPCLSDPRVSVLHDDFVAYVARPRRRYDIICMDIDNGPMLVVHEGNTAAYKPGFFRKVKAALRPAGLFVIWSCNRDAQLLADMQGVFADCREVEVLERHRGRDVPYYLYTARLTGDGLPPCPA